MHTAPCDTARDQLYDALNARVSRPARRRTRGQNAAGSGEGGSPGRNRRDGARGIAPSVRAQRIACLHAGGSKGRCGVPQSHDAVHGPGSSPTPGSFDRGHLWAFTSAGSKCDPAIQAIVFPCPRLPGRSTAARRCSRDLDHPVRHAVASPAPAGASREQRRAASRQSGPSSGTPGHRIAPRSIARGTCPMSRERVGS